MSSILQAQQLYTTGIPLLEAFYCQWPIIELVMTVSLLLATWSRFIRMRIFRGVKKWPTYRIAVCCTNRKRSSFATNHFQGKSPNIFDLHPPPRRLVLFVAWINTWKVRYWVTDTHTHRQTKYCNAAHARWGLINVKFNNNLLMSFKFPSESI